MVHTIIVTGAPYGEQLLKRSETLTEDTLESITQELGERDFLPPGRHFSISVISEEGNKTEIRTGSGLLDAAKDCNETILLCFERWDQEERVSAWIDYLKTWDDDKTALHVVPDDVKELTRAGIPHKLRREVYAYMAGVHHAKHNNEGLFRSYCQKIERSCEAKVLQDIDKDLRRTLTDHPAFQNYTAATRAMRRVLAAYSLHRPQVGYCQGMSFVVALLLFVTRQYPTSDEEKVGWEEIDDEDAEEDAFWMLHYMIERVLPPAYFGASPAHNLPQLRGLQRALLVISRLVETRQPQMVEHLESLGVPISCIVVRWLPCLFAGTMPVESVLRVWDMAMAEGMVAIYRAAIAVLEMQQTPLMCASESEDVPAAINGVMEDLQDAAPLVYWMHTSWPWLASWVYPPDITESITHGLYSDIREAEAQECAAEEREKSFSEKIGPGEKMEMSFLEVSWHKGETYFGEEELLNTTSSWCLVERETEDPGITKLSPLNSVPVIDAVPI